MGPVRAAFDELEEQAYLSQFNTDCYGYGLLASGHVDLIVEQDLQPYDYLPMLPILIQAGAKVSDWKDRPVGSIAGGRVLAAGDARIHAQALAVLSLLDD